MMILKSDQEIGIMREAGHIVAECHALIADTIKPGITTLAIDQMVEKHIRARGAVPSFKGHHGFTASICVAKNDVICHGFPDDAPLQDGDVVTLDVGAFYNGYHGDSGWTYAVGTVSTEIAQLMDVCHQSLLLGIEQAVVGNHIGDIGFTIDTFATRHGYGNVREFTGHGLGKDLWEEPPVPHYGRQGMGPRLKNGLVLAIEPMFTLGDWRAYVESDGWTARTIDHSICVQYEHTVAITDNGPEILTKL
ncbi:type I methionyl aminopeptidase [Paenibacillus sp. MER TA 81-3]|uniref:type I methionyl aminopeptidase n=1 Tax=Paenibacillus sp. MER TA 81-3 TaxID=2939573 RepID=UPI0020400A73|nr:type I methionyl aminopeptidase [Paenibacillus sp. MER TA 81-3]MCM3337686.1 type I methionyl aminopeptidase [Paenibacillus sp. MER TA 81-3]